MVETTHGSAGSAADPLSHPEPDGVVATVPLTFVLVVPVLFDGELPLSQPAAISTTDITISVRRTPLNGTACTANQLPVSLSMFRNSFVKHVSGSLAKNAREALHDGDAGMLDMFVRTEYRAESSTRNSGLPGVGSSGAPVALPGIMLRHIPREHSGACLPVFESQTSYPHG